MARQFKPVNCRYGAPMGRAHYGQADTARNVRLFKVRLDSGGYDDGGAYWGHGGALWCAIAPDTSETMDAPATDYQDFTRAASRREAMEALGLRPDQLLSKAGL